MHLWELRDPQTGLIMGRSPAMVRYLIVKAKHRHALQEHEYLLEELRAVRAEQSYWYEKKEELLDEFLKANFGSVRLFVTHLAETLTVCSTGLKQNPCCRVRK